jgi:hypothetical protein
VIGVISPAFSATGVLGELDELARVEQAALRMAPAQHPLGARDAPRRDVHLRLAVEQQLAIADRPVKVAHQRQVLGVVLVQAAGVERVTTAFVARLVQGHACASQQDIRVGAMAGEQRDTDARVRIDHQSRELHRIAQRHQHLVGDADRVFGAVLRQ